MEYSLTSVLAILFKGKESHYLQYIFIFHARRMTNVVNIGRTDMVILNALRQLEHHTLANNIPDSSKTHPVWKTGSLSNSKS